MTRFGEEVAPRLGKRLVALTGHHYAEGPPNNPRVTSARLLAGNPNVAATTNAIVRVADAHGLAYHMTEGNSCYRGGKPGMSNAFAAALWAGDYTCCCWQGVHYSRSSGASAHSSSTAESRMGMPRAARRSMALSISSRISSLCCNGTVNEALIWENVMYPYQPNEVFRQSHFGE